MTHLAYGTYNTLSKVTRNDQGEAVVVRDEELVRDLRAAGAQDLGGDVWRFDQTSQALTVPSRTPTEPQALKLPTLEFVGSMSMQWNLKPGEQSLIVTGPEFDAIVAGLRLLACEIDCNRVVYPSDEGDIGDIWTNAGEHEGLPAEDIHKLADRLLGN